MSQNATSQYERVTEVDRSSGLIFLRPPVSNDTSKVRTIYEEPSKGSIPDDKSKADAIDAAFKYLQDRKELRDLDQSDWLKVAFGSGIFVGMSVIYFTLVFLGMV